MSSAKMYSPMPASGLGGGSITITGPDRDLMRRLSDETALRTMMRNTPFRPSLPGGVPLAIPPAMRRLISSGLRVPDIAAKKLAQQAARGKFVDLVKPLLDPDKLPEGLVATGPRSSAGRFVIPGTSMTGCQFNGEANNTYHYHSPAAWNACAWGYQVMSFSEAMTLFNAQTASASFGELNNQVGAQGNPYRRMKYAWNKTAGSKPKLSQLVQDETLVGQMPRYERQMSTSVRRRTGAALSRYTVPARTIVLQAGSRGEIVRGGPPPRGSETHRNVPTKTEKKTKSKLGIALIGAYHKLTEINDLVDSLADAIPGNPCGNLPGFRKLVCVVNNWEKIDGSQAAINILVNEIEDQIVGRAQGRLRDALEKAGGPNSTQVQQWIRQLAMYIRGVL